MLAQAQQDRRGEVHLALAGLGLEGAEDAVRVTRRRTAVAGRR